MQSQPNCCLALDIKSWRAPWLVLEDKMCSTKLLSVQGLVLSKQTSLTVIISILGVESLFYYLMLE